MQIYCTSDIVFFNTTFKIDINTLDSVNTHDEEIYSDTNSCNRYRKSVWFIFKTAMFRLCTRAKLDL